MTPRSIACPLLFALAVGCAGAPAPSPPPVTSAVPAPAPPPPVVAAATAPAGDAGAPKAGPWPFQTPVVVRGEKGMVVSDNALATNVGRDMLASGGNAVDAAVALAFALAVTYPTAGNVGGGGFAVTRIKGDVKSLDFRETAPAAAT